MFYIAALQLEEEGHRLQIPSGSTEKFIQPTTERDWVEVAHHITEGTSQVFFIHSLMNAEFGGFEFVQVMRLLTRDHV